MYALLLSALPLPAIVSAEPLVLGKTRQLLINDSLIESSHSIDRTFERAAKHPMNPLVRPDKPWEEGMVQLFGSVMRDAGKFRMWYHCGSGVGYAESMDGISWKKPELNVVSVGGQKTNLVLHKSLPGVSFPNYLEFFGVIRDDTTTDPATRYKMGFLSLQKNYRGEREDPLHKGQRRGLGVAGSPDGIHWNLIDSWATEATCDGQSTWMYDSVRHEYVLYGRTMHTVPEVQNAWSKFPWYKKWHRGRSVVRTDSSNFLDWTRKDPLSAPMVLTPGLDDLPGSEFYSIMVFPYESGYLGLLQYYAALPDKATLDLRLMSSRDSLSFSRAGDRSFIELGEPGEWDRFTMCSANNPPLLVVDELWLYYSCGAYRHEPYDGPDRGIMSSSIGLASIKRDRFAALEASFDGGEIVTKPIELGGPLHVNAKCDHGTIVAQVLDASGTVLTESKPLQVDTTDALLEWNNGGVPTDKTVRLRLRLTNAKLYAIWCSE